MFYKNVVFKHFLASHMCYVCCNIADVCSGYCYMLDTCTYFNILCALHYNLSHYIYIIKIISLLFSMR